MKVFGELQYALLEKLAADPANTTARVYYNTGTNVVKYYDGTGWRTAQTLETAQTVSGQKTFSAAVLANSGIRVNATGSTLANYVAADTFTPTISTSGSASTVTYTSNTGIYTRIGNVVYFSLKIVVNTYTAGTGDLRISLPITANATWPHYFPVGGNLINVASGTQLLGIVTTSQAYFTLATWGDNIGDGTPSASALTAGSQIYCSGFYFV